MLPLRDVEALAQRPGEITSIGVTAKLGHDLKALDSGCGAGWPRVQGDASGSLPVLHAQGAVARGHGRRVRSREGCVTGRRAVRAEGRAISGRYTIEGARDGARRVRLA